MNNTEALRILDEQLLSWRARSWLDLRNDVGLTKPFEVIAESGRLYQGEVQVIWDHKPGGAIRVMGSIDDGGWRAFLPLTTDFIRAPDGTCVGEQAGRAGESR